jgi:hypothetical protein
LCFAGSEIVLRIEKLRICPVPEGIDPPFLSPPPLRVSVPMPFVELAPPNKTRLATLEFAIK